MTRRLASAALACAAVLVLAGCGQATEAPQVNAADDPVSTSGPETTQVGGGDTPTANTGDQPQADLPRPQWPTIGCASRSVVSVDYGRMPPGFETPEEAVANSTAVGLPDGVLTLVPYAGKGPAQVWVVDPESDEIQAQVSLFRGPDGWFVDGVMTCG